MGLSVDIDAANTVKSNILKNKSGEVLMEVNKGLTAAITYPQKNVLNGLPSQVIVRMVIELYSFGNVISFHLTDDSIILTYLHARLIYLFT